LFTLAVVKTGTFEVSYKLVIDCEEKLSGDIWRGEFLNRYIEEITAKAKNPK